MSEYEAELRDAALQALDARDAIEAWLSRPPDAHNDTPAAVLEGHAKALRKSRERLQALREQHGDRRDIVDALENNADYHAAVGLLIADAE